MLTKLRIPVNVIQWLILNKLLYTPSGKENAIPSRGVLSLIGGDPRPMADGGFNESLRYVLYGCDVIPAGKKINSKLTY